MSTNDLTSLLRRAGTGPRDRTAGCPDEQQIAAYVDGTLESGEREPLELHLADCDACVALVGLLSRQRDTAVFEPAPELAVARARALLKADPNRGQLRRWQRYAPRWAAAAMVIISVSAGIHLARPPDPGIEAQSPPEMRTTRSLAPSTSALQVLYPSPGMTVDARRLVVRWEAISGSRYYEVRIVTESGDVITEQRVTATEWRPPDDLNLTPGTEYFVHVDAYPSEAKTISSDHVPFAISDNP